VLLIILIIAGFLLPLILRLSQRSNTKGIAAHLSAAEKEESLRWAEKFGWWFGLTFAAPLALAFTEKSIIIWLLLIPCLIVSMAGEYRLHKAYQEFLFSTAWAKARRLS
jgi:fructose-specific phosphotransferase system IIC component